MKYSTFAHDSFQQIKMLPLSWLNLSRSKCLLLLLLSYGVGSAGLLLLFPQTHNGATMFLPIVCACWLLYYRGFLVSLVLNGIIFQLSYTLFWQGILPGQAFMGGAIIGFGTSLGLGLLVCWLRAAVDQVHTSRQQTFVAEQAHLLTLLKERQARLAYEQQREINLLKDQFLLNVSHELRTPLTVLGGYLELLELQEVHLDESRYTLALREALKSKEELGVLVDRLLDATKVTNDIPRAKLEPVNMHRFLQEVLTHLSPLHIQNYTIRLYIPEHIMVLADPAFLRQVLNNLFSNVFKYVPPRTEILIEAAQADPLAPVCLGIQDSGPGIPAEELPGLFEKFVRLKRDLAGSISGTGLGLYICRQLVEAMGGQIWVESPAYENDGSRFCLSLAAYAPT
ncbi:MAG TPA: HAMP domain-containing sensor histidine kinase [Ktedonobacteraceae bacterium]